MTTRYAELTRGQLEHMLGTAEVVRRNLQDNAEALGDLFDLLHGSAAVDRAALGALLDRWEAEAGLLAEERRPAKMRG